jgi:tetratricopeptide (TPR) repeat protein
VDRWVDWFTMTKREGASSYQTAVFAEYLEQQARHAEAAAAFLEASKDASRYSYVCSAGKNYVLAEKLDEVLAAERKCIELATSKKGTDGWVSYAHRTIAYILNQRNVFDEAASHAKEARQIAPNDEWAHHNL